MFASGVVVFVLRDQATSVRVAAALLTGMTMLALSPPEAIAVISESQAAGPFTRLVLGATVVMDVVVVVGFSVALTPANALLGEGVSLGGLVTGVAVGLLLSMTAGRLVGLLVTVTRRTSTFRSAAVLIVDASVVSVWVAVVAVQWAEERLGVHAEVESLLVTMIAGVLVANTAGEKRFAEILERLAPPVYVVFFTLTGSGCTSTRSLQQRCLRHCCGWCEVEDYGSARGRR